MQIIHFVSLFTSSNNCLARNSRGAMSVEFVIISHHSETFKVFVIIYLRSTPCEITIKCFIFFELNNNKIYYIMINYLISY